MNAGEQQSSEELSATAAGETTAEREGRAARKPTPMARQRHAAISAEIDEHQYRYYILEQPTASDAEYDTLMRELIRLEEEFPALQTPNSPTQRVPGEFSSAFASVQHAEPLLSLDNVFSSEQLEAW